MYTKGMLNRFADTVEDEGLREEFRARIETIVWEGGGKVCMGPALEEALKGSPAESLISDLNDRITSLIGDEDTKTISELFV
ncbi:hypothetical protein K9L63_03390 [Candidatus Gracilibacteria bacterium]|nr:hypothetical protein [Candidatus Gracilibacteria bacterium]